jgi:hypothetical protein
LDVQKNEKVNLYLPCLKEGCPDTMFMEEAECDGTLIEMFLTATGQRPRSKTTTKRKDVISLKNAAYVVRARRTRLVPEQGDKTGPGRLVCTYELRAM